MYLVAVSCLHAMKIVQVQTVTSVSTPYVLKMMMVSAISNVLVVNDDISDTEPFEVALVETTYTVDENVGISECVCSISLDLKLTF